MIPDVFVRRKLYSELGGYPGYRKTPVKEILQCRLSIIAEWKHEDKVATETKEEQEKLREELQKGSRR